MQEVNRSQLIPTLRQQFYRNVLTRECGEHETIVDPKITFKIHAASKVGNDNLNKKRDSSSSEDRIDTSDELMEIDDELIHENFVTEVPREVRRG